ncbi:MAG: outer membrane beta-barrel protein [Elusimicrobia bacterium]|nr:outer membrane beta-barrel protein [Elusimicrobiota bacterium]
MTTKKTVGLLLLVATMTAPFVPASALDDFISKGNLELSLLGSYSKTSPSQGGSSSQSLLGGGVGYFITQPLEVGTAFFVTGMKSGGTTLTYTSVAPFVKWHFFPNPKVVPYVGTGFTVGGITMTGTDSIGIVGFGFNGGADFFVKERIAIGPELRWDHTAMSSAYIDYSANVVTLLAQVKVFFF